MRDHGFAAQKSAAQIECNGAVPFLDGHVFDLGQARVTTGAGNQDVDTAVGVDRGRDRRGNGFFVGDIDGNWRGATAGGDNGVGNDLCVLGVDIEECDGRALRGKVARGFGAYALRRSGNDDDARGEFGKAGHASVIPSMTCTSTRAPAATLP